MATNPNPRTDKLWGELWLDAEGEAHFLCHTPGERTFDETREGLTQFRDLIQDQLDRERECPMRQET